MISCCQHDTTPKPHTPYATPHPPPAQIVFAREYLKEVGIGPKQVQYLVEEARRGGVQVRQHQ